MKIFKLIGVKTTSTLYEVKAENEFRALEKLRNHEYEKKDEVNVGDVTIVQPD